VGTNGPRRRFKKRYSITIHCSGLAAYFCKIFGPVVSVATFETEAEAVELANSTVYGLGAAVFSSDASQCMRLTSAIDSGTVRRVDPTRGTSD
jgi:acyl-CoA reductase-like NAD-dependent aldehyde dehydrogenase